MYLESFKIRATLNEESNRAPCVISKSSNAYIAAHKVSKLYMYMYIVLMSIHVHLLV